MATKRPAKRKYPKIPAGNLTAAEIIASHNITPLEMRRAKRALALALQDIAAKKAARKAARLRAASK